jgi:hypothetical protein
MCIADLFRGELRDSKNNDVPYPGPPRAGIDLTQGRTDADLSASDRRLAQLRTGSATRSHRYVQRSCRISVRIISAILSTNTYLKRIDAGRQSTMIRLNLDHSVVIGKQECDEATALLLVDKITDLGDYARRQRVRQGPFTSAQGG